MNARQKKFFSIQYAAQKNFLILIYSINKEGKGQ